MSMGNTWRNSCSTCILYTYNKMLPLSPGEFMRPFLLTFTLILWYINTIYLTIYYYIQLYYTPFDICPLCDDIRQQTSPAMFVPKIHDLTNALIIFCFQPHFLHLKCIFLTVLKFSIFFKYYYTNKLCKQIYFHYYVLEDEYCISYYCFFY